MEAWEQRGAAAWEDLETGDLELLRATRRQDEERRKKARLRRNEVALSVRKGVIRNLVVVLDLSTAATDKNPRFKPSCLNVTISALQGFIPSYFDQNPMSKLCLLTMGERRAARAGPGANSDGGATEKNGQVSMLTELSANPKNHVERLKAIKRPGGAASIQNAVENARTMLQHVPPYGSREVVILSSSITTVDPGDIFATIAAAKEDKVRCSVIGTGAEVYVYRKLADRTDGRYDIAPDKNAFLDALHRHIPPLATVLDAPAGGGGAGGGAGGTGAGGGGAGAAGAAGSGSGPAVVAEPKAPMAYVMRMGFPTQTSEDKPMLCACHGKFRYNGYKCPRCLALMCDIPSECHVCGINLVSAPQLARTYHHLYAVPAFTEIGEGDGEDGDDGEDGEEGEGEGGTGDEIEFEDSAEDGEETKASGGSGRRSSGGGGRSKKRRREESGGDGGEATGRGKGGAVGAAGAAVAAVAGERCFGCRKPMSTAGSVAGAKAGGGRGRTNGARGGKGGAGSAVAAPMRLRCPRCRNVFCVDCDVYIHEVLHNCPGCGLAS